MCTAVCESTILMGLPVPCREAPQCMFTATQSCRMCCCNCRAHL